MEVYTTQTSLQQASSFSMGWKAIDIRTPVEVLIDDEQNERV
jgi:hypothetical protein